MNYSKLLYIASSILLAACNTNTNSKSGTAITKQTDTTHTVKNTALEKLLSHFKTNNSFPVITDTNYIYRLNLKDSLGTNEVKMLLKKWYSDSLLEDTTFLKDFYVIDSVKAKHIYKQWYDSLKDMAMQPETANAYGLQQITLTDSTKLLVWAFMYANVADPSYNVTDIYFTLIYKDNITKTFLLGYHSIGADPPNFDNVTLTSKLTADGKLQMELNGYNGDLDTAVGNANHSQYQYQISKGNIALTNKASIYLTMPISKMNISH